MLARLRAKLSYANVVATLSLCLVIGGGTAYAVTQIDANSVKSKHIVDGQVKSADIADDRVSAADIAGFSVLKNIGQFDVDPALDETQVVELMSDQDLAILGSCQRTAANVMTAKLLVSSSTSGSAFTSTATPDGFIVNPGDGNVEVATLASAPSDEREHGLITFAFTSQFAEVIHGTVSALVHSPFDGPNDCVFTGFGLG